MDTPLLDNHDQPTSAEDDSQSYMDEDDVREVRLHHWLSETAGAQFMQNSALTRADSPLLGFDHHLMQTHELESNKPLPELPPAISRLRPQSSASSIVPLSPMPQTTPSVSSVALLRHRYSPSQQSLRSTHSPSPASSRRPSLARKPSLPLLNESTPLPVTPPPRRSSRMHSISSSISLVSNRNAVYIEEVNSRLDKWLTTANPEMKQDDDDQDVNEYYAMNFEGQQDSAAVTSLTPSYTQGPPPNTPMTGYYNTPHASSSQIYLGKGIPSVPQPDDALDVSPDQEDVRATPVPHGRLPNPDVAISCSTSSGSLHGSPLFSAATLSTSPTSPSSPVTVASKPSLSSISMGVLSPKPSLTSIGFGYLNQVSSPSSGNNTLSPPPATASRWSLTSSIAGDAEKDKKKKEKGTTRKRLASFISKISGNTANKEAKEDLDNPMPDLERIRTRERSLTDASLRENVLLSPPKIKSKSKPPSLKLGPLANSHSVSNLRSPTLSTRPSLTSLSTPLSPAKSSTTSSTPTPTFPPSIVSSPASASFGPISPIKKSFTATRLSVSTTMTTTSTNTASPLMPNTPILNDAPLASPALKNAISVPALSPAWEGPGLLRRDNSYGWNMNTGYFGESAPTSPTSGYDDDEEDVEDAAEYYVREFAESQKDTLEEERKARLSLIADMLDRDLNSTQQQKDEVAKELRKQGSVLHKPKELVKPGSTEVSFRSNAPSPIHVRKSSSASRTSSIPQRRSVSGPAPAVPTTPSSPQAPSRTGFRNLAARIGISNSHSTPQSPPTAETESKRKSLATLMSNGKRKEQKRRLVIRGVGDGARDVEALKEWCSSLGEVRSMVRVKSADGVVTQIDQGEGCGRSVWVVDFKKSSVAERVCRLQAKVEIKGAGSVHLSWETAKPKLRFNVGKMGWIP